ncbi:MAG: multiheme c-type cytochrome [Phycisphaerae bacterium]
MGERMGQQSGASTEQNGVVSSKAMTRRGASVVAALLTVNWVCNLALAMGELPQSKTSGEKQLPVVNPSGWTSSVVCSECHQAIFAVWRQSLHANAWSNRVFQAAYKRAKETYGAERARVCLSCHAPTVRHGEDYNVEQPITAEGVTCDFCHSISAVDLNDPRDSVRLTVGSVKYGPLRHAQSPAHKIVDSQLHTSAEFCAACHEYRNSHGVSVLGTYSEWKGSYYAKRGTQCQDCHMPLVPGRVVALEVKGDAPTSVNLHDVSGSHDIGRVREAITLELEGYEWITDEVRVYVKVANKGSGHCFPTGLPMHRAVLEVSIKDRGRVVGQKDVPFEVVMLNEKGTPLRREHEVFVQAARIRSDTRLKPGESRSIDVVFRDVESARLTVSAALYYQYSTEALVERDGEEHMEAVEMKFLVASRQNSMKPLGR